LTIRKIILPLALINISIGPTANSFTVTLILPPFTIIHLATDHLETAASVNLTFLIFANILAAIGTGIFTVSRTEAIGIFTYIHIAISKVVFALTMLYIVAPLAGIFISIRI
jgi:hypothetical protein